MYTCVYAKHHSQGIFKLLSIIILIVEYSGPIYYKTSRGVKFNSYFSTVLTFDHMYTNYIMSSTGKDTTSNWWRKPKVSRKNNRSAASL
jgi:hypothetical protein